MTARPRSTPCTPRRTPPGSRAAELEQQYQARLEDVKQESDALLRQAADRARAREAEIVAEAKQQARTLRESAEAQIAQEKKKAVNELKGEIGGIAMEIASQVVEREVARAGPPGPDRRVHRPCG